MRPAAAVLALAVFGTPACIDIAGAGYGRYVEQETKHFTTGGTPDLALSTFDGSIEVRAWDKPDVEILIEKHATTKELADSIVIDARQEGNRVFVDAKVPPMRGFHFGTRGAKLIVSAPAPSNVTAKSGDGSITIERITGTVDLRSGDGSIQGRELKGNVRAHTGDGSIRLDGVDGALDAQTGDGSIVASGAMTTVRARSGDGTVSIHASTETPQGDWEVTTGDGSIALEIPPTFNAHLDATTHDGRVNLQNVTVADVTGTLRHGAVQGRLGSGGPTVRLRTGDGSIRVTSPTAHE